ncbi:hypothetical protein [Desulfotruncus arcticus]|nr:hypothetical protein [Desulfotruncus arcticus]
MSNVYVSSPPCDIIENSDSYGRLYVAVIFDCFDGTIVGLKIANHMKA